MSSEERFPEPRIVSDDARYDASVALDLEMVWKIYDEIDGRFRCKLCGINLFARPIAEMHQVIYKYSPCVGWYLDSKFEMLIVLILIFQSLQVNAEKLDAKIEEWQRAVEEMKSLRKFSTQKASSLNEK